ncbi:hypothetical protein CYR75_13405 [Paracoccus jeotgali]|uniref:Amidohydrolase n=2 Tax=Paracoccus jeotgali TaxID=2065379 RepID=A0A2K9MJA6_9RHOB|nr:hypothetical protein CYR75_13405 [Paracoccus jeotgali]
MQQVVAKVEADNARQVEIFKDLHEHPELGFMETRTAGVLAQELEALGFDVQTGIGKTGVVATLTNGPGPTVMYRADMDANAVEEATGLPYASKVRAKRADGTESPVAQANHLAVPLRDLLGEKNVVTEFPPATGSEDVHLLLGDYTDVPFNFLIVGVADPDVFAAALKEGKQMPYSAHNPNFIVDLAAIPVGTKIATVAMLNLLAKEAAP